MPAMTSREQRTVRYAAVGVAIYLVLFFGVKGFVALGKHKLEYQRMRSEAENLRREILPYEAKTQMLAKWMESFKLDPARLKGSTLAAEASAAIQSAARSGGIVFTLMRESVSRGSERELATFLFEGSGPVPALMTLIQGLGSLGYPLVIDAIQFSSDPTRPGGIKISLTVVLLNFENWKQEGAPNV